MAESRSGNVLVESRTSPEIFDKSLCNHVYDNCSNSMANNAINLLSCTANVLSNICTDCNELKPVLVLSDNNKKENQKEQDDVVHTIVRDEKENQSCPNGSFKKIEVTCYHVSPAKAPLSSVSYMKTLPTNHTQTRQECSATAKQTISRVESPEPTPDASVLHCPMNGESQPQIEDLALGGGDVCRDADMVESRLCEKQLHLEDQLTSLTEQELLKTECSDEASLKEQPENFSSLHCSLPENQEQEEPLQPALRLSLFPNVPPTVNFYSPGVKVEQLPKDITKFMKWKRTKVTPIVVKKAVCNSNFKLTNLETNMWAGIWGKHMKSNQFNTVKHFQKVNHFPGTFQIGRKDLLWHNLFHLRGVHGKAEFGFFPKTYVLSKDMNELVKAWESSEENNGSWIVKPPSAARGEGIKVIHKMNQLPKKRPLIVQKYLAKPYLINGTKFDLRLYVYVTSFDPLRIYLYPNGLVRFASVKYASDLESLNDRFMHLTNYSINKDSQNYIPNDDQESCEGHKWALTALWGYMKAQGIDTDHLWARIEDIVIKTIISCESTVTSLSNANVKSRYCCHELFGFDIMIDENIKPWLLEVNISPSLHSTSPLDIAVKSQLVKDVFTLCGFRLPERADKNVTDALAAQYGVTSVTNNRAYYSAPLSTEEKVKHARFVVLPREQYLTDILHELTPDDVRRLTETEDELARKGSFIRLFPSHTSHKYHQFLKTARYYTCLLDSWEHRYHSNRKPGISLLRSLCSQNVHLQGLKPVTKKKPKDDGQCDQQPADTGSEEPELCEPRSKRRKQCEEETS